MFRKELDLKFLDLFKFEKIKYLDQNLMVIDGLYDAKEIAPRKTSANTIMLCTNGSIDISISGKPIKACAGEVMICPSMVLASGLRFSPNMSCTAICISDRFMDLLLHNYFDVWNRAMYVYGIYVLDRKHIKLSELQKILSMIDMMKDDDPCDKDFIYFVVRLMLIKLCSLIIKNGDNGIKDRNGTYVLFDKFISILSQSEIKRHTVAYYSEKLNVSPAYLSHVCKKASERTTKECIDAFIKEQLNFYLLATDLDMKTIAFKTGFPNTSSLSNYCRSIYEMSPLDYREKFKQNL